MDAAEHGDPVVRVRGLVKRYGRLAAVDGLDLEVARGEVHGLLGPDGAGKSTTLRVLAGLLAPDGGEAEVLGHEPWRDVVALQPRLAYVPEDVVLWPDLTAGEAIDLLGELRGGLDRRRRAELLERLDVDPTRPGREHSRVQRRKVALVAALAARVDLLLLDEPSARLEPAEVATLHDEVVRAREEGRTVLLSSSVLGDLQALADRVSLLRRGRVVHTGSREQLRTRAAAVGTPPAPVAAPVDLAEHRARREAEQVEQERSGGSDEPADLGVPVVLLHGLRRRRGGPGARPTHP